MGTAHCLGHSGTGQWTGTAGDLCPASCRCSLCQSNTLIKGSLSRRALPQPSQFPTHGDSSVGWPAHGSQAYSGHSVAPLCGISSADIAPCGGHRHQGPWGQCSHCTHRAGTGHLALMGPQSAQGHKLRTAVLPTVGEGMSVQFSCPTLTPCLRLTYSPVYPALQWHMICWEYPSRWQEVAKCRRLPGPSGQGQGRHWPPYGSRGSPWKPAMHLQGEAGRDM